jgi:phytoene desaturase
MTESRIVVVGGGVAGASAACYLAQAGRRVTLIEKHNHIGGRLRSLEVDGYSFDMGPSWYWMPDVFEKFFLDFGVKVDDCYKLTRLSPSYRVFWKERKVVDLPPEMDKLTALFDSFEEGSGKKLTKFLAQAEYKYRQGMQKFVYLPGLSFTEVLDLKLFAGLKLDMFWSFHDHVAQFFTHPFLQELIEFPVLFLGAPAERLPALYSMMTYADMVGGTWYPKGGMKQIGRSLEGLLHKLGVDIVYGQEVDEFLFSKGGRVSGVKLVSRKIVDASTIIWAGDYAHCDQKILPAAMRHYSDEYWDSRVLAPSCLIFYLGIQGTVETLLHHNLFFDEDLKAHSKSIYDTKDWPLSPLFYVSVSSRTDTSVAPPGCENVFILIPLAPGLETTPELVERYYEYVVKKIHHRTGDDLRMRVKVRKVFEPQDFATEYFSLRGNAYGLANTLKQTWRGKPSIKSKKVKGLYYAGQLTVPGPGVPPALISGKVVSDLVLKETK